MSLKILILPVFVILEVVLVIGYIKPNISAILAKQAEMATAEAELAQADLITGNIQTLSQSLAERSEMVSFVDRYYPSALDEERVVDMFNYLAQQSGVIVSGVKITPKPVTQTSASAYDEALNAGMSPEQATAHAEAAVRATPQGYKAEVAVFGAYPNIKDFFSRVYHADRLHETTNLAIAYRKPEATPAEDEAVQGILPNFLIGTFEANFPYVGKQLVGEPLTEPMFQSATMDFEPAEQAFTFVTSPLPPLDSGAGGRPNPFE
ncbi:MAG: hypothetical protein WAT84_03120 [Candidatus Moraniibacteriota bacterium]